MIWKEAMEKKGLRVNAGKTKVMICGTGLNLLQSSGEYPCAVCLTGVGNNSIYCNGCKLWVHKKCSGIQPLTPNPDYRCAQCMGNARPIDSRPQNEAQVGPDKLEVVVSFCYLFSHPANSLTRHVAMYTALACRAPCSMPVKLGH